MNLINLEYVIILSFEFSESNVQHQILYGLPETDCQNSLLSGK